jgi:hypothetical protein
VKITRGQLIDSDYETLFTRDPKSFIEAIVINLMWAKGNETEMAIIERQRYLFEEWLKLYTVAIKEDAHAEHAAREQDNRQAVARTAFIKGQIAALSTLPLKKNKINQEVVDLARVTSELKTLRGMV